VRSLVIGTAGHIDHGKSALVQALTGIDPDRLQEEKARGITIDLGFAHLERGDVSIAFVDVPGHERFVRNMLAGAGGIDAVVLVVAADESVKPQTREHFEICRLLGVQCGVVALTKADLADAEMRAVAAMDVRELVAGSFLEGAPVVPVSVRTGEGLDALVTALAGLAGGARRLARAGVTRLPIDRVFTVRGFGTVVTGTLVSGRLAVGDALVVEPGARPVRVRGLHVHGAAVGDATAPRRVAANLAGVDAQSVVRGDTLATAEALTEAWRFDAQLQLLPAAGELRHGARVRVHQGTGDATGRVSIAAVRSHAAEAWRAARPGDASVAAPPGGQALARIRLDRPLVLTRHDRVVLRMSAPVGTIGGGAVLDPEPPSAGVRRPDTLERLVRLTEPDLALDVWLRESGVTGLPIASLVRRAGAPPDVAAAAVGEACARGAALQVESSIFSGPAVAAIEQAVLDDLAAWHRANPADPGPMRESVRGRAARRAAAALFDRVIDRLRAAGRVTGTDRLALSTYRPATSSSEDRAAQAMEALIRAGGLTPPDLGTIASAIGVTPSAAEPIALRLGREKRLVRVDTMWFHPSALDGLREAVRALRPAGGAGPPATIDVGAFKTKFGLSRKFAVPLLEWLDRERITRRVGDRRVIL
jgi:selenocysteine-specific elongation factor